MLHKCAHTSNGCKKTADSACKRGYDITYTKDATIFNDKGFPLYKRTAECDLKVVATNHALLLDWNGHVNVEFAGNARCVLYLYDYLYKGIFVYIFIYMYLRIYTYIYVYSCMNIYVCILMYVY
jgi:hypothetical protein